MAGTLMVFDEPDFCALCAQTLPPKTCAWWDRTDQTVICTTCRPTGATLARPSLTSLPPPVPIGGGLGRTAAPPQYERRVPERRRQPGVIFGEQLVSDIGVTLVDESPSTTPWGDADGDDDERSFAALLDREIGHAAIVLHDRRVSVTRGNIDHLVVSSTGIWLIDTKDYAGKVECRNARGRETPEPRLFVAHRNQTKLVAGMTDRTRAVLRALERVDLPDVPVQGCLCFTDAYWPFRSKPVSVDGVWVGSPQALIKTLRATPVLERSMVATLAQHLSTQFPASS